MVKVTAEIGAGGGELTPVEFTVSPGSLYTLIRPETAQGLGLKLSATALVGGADNDRVEVPVGIGRVRLMGREEPVMLGVMDAPAPRLGRMALQALGLKVNPATGSLEYALPYPPLA